MEIVFQKLGEGICWACCEQVQHRVSHAGYKMCVACAEKFAYMGEPEYQQEMQMEAIWS